MHSKVVGAGLLDLEVNFPVGEGTVHVIGLVGGQCLEGGNVGGIGTDHQAHALHVVGKGVAHVHNQGIGDALLDSDTRRNQVVVGSILVIAHVVGTRVDAPVAVIIVEAPGIFRTPIGAVVVGIDNGPQVAGRCIAEVVVVGRHEGVAGEDGVGNCLLALLAVGIERGNDVVVALHLGGKGLAELTSAQALGHEHVTGHAHDVVGHVLEVTAVDTGSGSIPRQVAHAVLDGEGHVGNGQRGVIACKGVHVVDG